jgi:ribosomal protein L7/L12
VEALVFLVLLGRPKEMVNKEEAQHIQAQQQQLGAVVVVRAMQV